MGFWVSGFGVEGLGCWGSGSNAGNTIRLSNGTSCEVLLSPTTMCACRCVKVSRFSATYRLIPCPFFKVPTVLYVCPPRLQDSEVLNRAPQKAHKQN